MNSRFSASQLLIYEKIAKLTKEHILTLRGIDVVSPTGTAIQNARTGGIEAVNNAIAEPFRISYSKL